MVYGYGYSFVIHVLVGSLVNTLCLVNNDTCMVASGRRASITAVELGAGTSASRRIK